MRRAESMLCLLLFTACSTRAPEAATPTAASVEPVAAPAPSDSRPPIPPIPASAPATPPPLELDAAELAAVDATCNKACQEKPCKCDAIRPLADFLLVHLVEGQGVVTHAWYVVQRAGKDYVPLTKTYEHTDAGVWSQYTEPDSICHTRVENSPLPVDIGVVRVEHPDLNLDGRDDLLIECRSDGGDFRQLRYCLSSEQSCAEPVKLREVWSGQILIDVDVEFRNGWFVRTIRKDNMGSIKGNLRVNGVSTPDPRP